MNNRQKTLSVIPMFIAAGLVIWGLLWYAGTFQRNQTTREELLEGTVAYIAASARIIVLNNENGDPINLTLVSNTKVYDEGSRSVDLTYVRQGSNIQAQGVYLTEDTFAPSSIRIIRR